MRGGMLESEQRSAMGILLAVGDFPDGGATSMRLRYMAQAIHQGGVGIEVALLQPTTKKAIPGNECTEGVLQGVPYRYLSGRTVRPGSVLGAVWDTLAGIGAFIRLALLTRTKPAFVIFYTPTFWKMVVPMLAAKVRGIPIFIEACEVWSTIPKEDLKSLTRRAVASGDRWLERWIPRMARGVIPISHNIANFYVAQGVQEDRLFLLPILVDMELYRQRSDAEIKSLKSIDYFLSSGSFGEKDGLAFMVEAFECVADEFPEIRLVFTGNVDEKTKEETLGLLKSARLRDRIVFTGFISRDQLVWAYQNARALLCCRSNSLYANYGFPTKLGEYLASGSPVIATKVGDVDHYLEDGKNAYLAVAEDSGAIAECMRMTLRNRNAAVQIGLEGQRVAERHFCYPVYSPGITEFLRSLSS